MDKKDELEIIAKGISYLDSLLELYTMTDDVTSARCREIAERRENLIQCLSYVTADRRNRNRKRRI